MLKISAKFSSMRFVFTDECTDLNFESLPGKLSLVLHFAF